MNATIWLVALLSLSLPAEYELAGNTSERIAYSPGPPGYYATEEFRSWRTPEGKALYLFLWKPSAPRALGPMAMAAEWPLVVAGQNTRIIETSQFMGSRRRVLVTHLSFSEPKAAAMIYTTGIEREEFEKLLSGVKIVAEKD